MQIRVCPQALQSYIFLILGNKIELIHWSPSPRGLLLSMLMNGVKSFMSSLLSPSPLRLMANRPRGKEDSHTYTFSKRASMKDQSLKNSPTHQALGFMLSFFLNSKPRKSEPIYKFLKMSCSVSVSVICSIPLSTIPCSICWFISLDNLFPKIPQFSPHSYHLLALQSQKF